MFNSSLHTIIESRNHEGFICDSIDLPSLQSIELGKFALAGYDNSSCSLTMLSLKGWWDVNPRSSSVELHCFE